MLWNIGGSGKGKEFRLKSRVHGSKPQAGSLSCRGVPGAPVRPGHVWGCRAERRVPPRPLLNPPRGGVRRRGWGAAEGTGVEPAMDRRPHNQRQRRWPHAGGARRRPPVPGDRGRPRRAHGRPSRPADLGLRVHRLSRWLVAPVSPRPGVARP